MISSVAEYLAGEGALEPESTVAVWPHPYKDPEVREFVEHPNVSTVYVANGVGDTPAMQRLHGSDPKIQALDHLYEREILSYDLPELVEAGEIPAVDVEYARDPAMSVFHNAAYIDAMTAMHADSSEERRDRVHAVFSGILADNAAASAGMLAEDGAAVYATDDFGMAARSPRVEEGVSGYEEKKTAYIGAIMDALEERFSCVDVLVNDGSKRPVYRDRRYIAARGPE